MKFGQKRNQWQQTVRQHWCPIYISSGLDHDVNSTHATTDYCDYITMGVKQRMRSKQRHQQTTSELQVEVYGENDKAKARTASNTLYKKLTRAMDLCPVSLCVRCDFRRASSRTTNIVICLARTSRHPSLAYHLSLLIYLQVSFADSGFKHHDCQNLSLRAFRLFLECFFEHPHDARQFFNRAEARWAVLHL